MEPIVLAVLVILGIAFFGGLIYYTRAQAKKRTEDIAQAAQEMGLDFSLEGDYLLSRFTGFKLFGRGYSRSVRNVITGDAGDVAIVIFDYQFTVGSGKNKSTHRQSIVALTSSLFHAPDLTIRPEGFFDRIGNALGFKDIDFDSHPAFSSMFVLKGSNEEAIREFMTPELLRLFESKPKICLEADGGTMFFYKPRTIIPPAEIKDHLAEAYEIYNCVVGES